MNATKESKARQIIIDAQSPNELRVAISDGANKKNKNTLTDLHIEDRRRQQYKSNVYLGTITSIEPSLNAIFVQFDENKRHGFLPFKEIDPKYYQSDDTNSPKKKKANTPAADQPDAQTSKDTNEKSASEVKVVVGHESEPTHHDTNDATVNLTITPVKSQPKASSVNFEMAEEPISSKTESQPEAPSPSIDNELIAKQLKLGQTILVQIVKEERGTKGAALTTYISLASLRLVLMPNNANVAGISRRIEGSARDDTRELAKQLTCADNMGFIIRTAGLNQEASQLQWDLDSLTNLWVAIKQASETLKPPALIHQESDVATCAVRDHLRPEVSGLIVNDKETHDKIKHYLKQIKPDFAEKVEFYSGSTPIFCHYGIENQIEQATSVIRLPSGDLSLSIQLKHSFLSTLTPEPRVRILKILLIKPILRS